MKLKLNKKHSNVARTIKGEGKRKEEGKTTSFIDKAKENSYIKYNKFDTTKEKYICNAYENGEALMTIVKVAKSSKGFIYTTLRKYGIQERRLDLGKVHDSVKHITDNPETLDNFTEDYYVLTLDELLWKYKIHKNGAYYVLDKLGIPRKRGNIFA